MAKRDMIDMEKRLSDEDRARIAELEAEYYRLMHAMQAGVAMELGQDPISGSPKHLRVGVNSALVGHSILVELLVRAGVCTLREYWETSVKWWQDEVDAYKARIAERLGIEPDRINLV